MKCLNSSYRLACLQCSLTDKELGEFIQHKKRTEEISQKVAVGFVGLQDDGTWVLSRNVHLSSSGRLIPPSGSSYVWIGHVYGGIGVASCREECNISLPLSPTPLAALFEKIRTVFKHNFFPCILVIASTILSLQYENMLKNLNFCPIPLAFGESGTGKTTALQCGLALIGAWKKRFYSKLSQAKILQLCSDSSIPVGVDDPQSKNDISRLMIDLYNGAFSATVSRGVSRPKTTCIISANFTTVDQQR